MNRIALRRETKTPWETRVAIAPGEVEALLAGGAEVVVERSPKRVFDDARYAAVGAEVSDSVDADLIIGVKEVDAASIQPGAAYLFFSHTIKAQAYNMEMLARLLEQGATLMDHELITDDDGQRLVAFGVYAGYAGAVETLAALGSKLEARGLTTPLAQIKQPYHYESLAEARAAVAAAGEALKAQGLPEALRPMTFGVLGNGKVSVGVQAILDDLGVEWVAPHELDGLWGSPDPHALHAAVYEERHMVERVDGGAFDLSEYYDSPSLYRSTIHGALPRMRVLFNGIYWEERYPVFVPNALLQDLHAQGQLPLAIGDITCDIQGSIEATHRGTDPGEPCYTFLPEQGHHVDGVVGDGVTIMAVDMLPCEFPADASREFSRALAPFLPGLARADFQAPSAEAAGLPAPMERAVIAWRGELTERWAWLAEHLPG